MRIFVAGATGLMGRRAVAQLLAAGHDVTGVARSDAKAAELVAQGANPARVDIFDAVGLRPAVTGHDVVMNLATHVPPLRRSVMPSAWSEHERIRREASQNLVAAAVTAGASRYVQESIALFYVDGGNGWLDEDAEQDTLPGMDGFLVAEEQTRRFAEQGGAGVALRFGSYYAADSEQTASMLKVARLGVSPFPGSRPEYFPTIHADDAASAVVAALAAPTGLYNVVADPQTKGVAADQLAPLVGRKKLRFPPRALTTAGGPGAKALMRSARVSSERFRTATGWAPTYASVADGYAEVLRSARP